MIRTLPLSLISLSSENELVNLRDNITVKILSVKL